MERIGIAASKMAKGNLFLYNLFVIVISFLFAMFIFFIAGMAIFIALFLIVNLIKNFCSVNFEKEWISILLICMISLAIGVGFFCLIAISRNIKFTK